MFLSGLNLERMSTLTKLLPWVRKWTFWISQVFYSNTINWQNRLSNISHHQNNVLFTTTLTEMVTRWTYSMSARWVKACDQNGEIVGENGLQILTFWRSLQTGKMSSSSINGGWQTANAGNVRSREPLCRLREKNTRCLISLMFS